LGVKTIAFVEEFVALLPEIGRGLYATLMDDPAVGDLTLPQAKALIVLYNQGDRSLTELAAGLAVSLPSASELVDRLADRGLAVRAADPADRRRVVISLTEPAIAYGRRIHDLRRAQARAALESMPGEEHECFIRSLRILATTLASAGGNRPNPTGPTPE